MTVSLRISSISENDEEKAICWICHTFWKIHCLLRRKVEIIGISPNTLLQTHLQCRKQQGSYQRSMKTLGKLEGYRMGRCSVLQQQGCTACITTTLNIGHCQMYPLGRPRFYHSQQSSEQKGTFACMAAPLGHRETQSWEAGQLREAGLCYTSLCQPPSSKTPLAKQLLDWRGKPLNPCKQTCHMIPARALIWKSYSVTCSEVKYHFIIFS